MKTNTGNCSDIYKNEIGTTELNDIYSNKFDNQNC